MLMSFLLHPVLRFSYRAGKHHFVLLVVRVESCCGGSLFDWCPYHERPLCLLIEHDGNSTFMQCHVSTIDDSLTSSQLHPARSRLAALPDAENFQLVSRVGSIT